MNDDSNALRLALDQVCLHNPLDIVILWLKFGAFSAVSEEDNMSYKPRHLTYDEISEILTAVDKRYTPTRIRTQILPGIMSDMKKVCTEYADFIKE